MIKEFEEFPGIKTEDSSEELVPFLKIERGYQRQLERAYKLGVLHGINAQSMAQVKRDVMEFDDYGWDVE